MYSTNQITFAAFVGGPFAGFWLLHKNYLEQNNLQNAKIFKYIAVISTFVITALMIVLPEEIFPALALPIGYTAAARQQSITAYNKHFTKITVFEAWPQVVLYTILNLIFFVALAFGVLYLLVEVFHLPLLPKMAKY